MSGIVNSFVFRAPHLGPRNAFVFLLFDRVKTMRVTLAAFLPIKGPYRPLAWSFLLASSALPLVRMCVASVFPAVKWG